MRGKGEKSKIILTQEITPGINRIKDVRSRVKLEKMGEISHMSLWGRSNPSVDSAEVVRMGSAVGNTH